MSSEVRDSPLLFEFREWFTPSDDEIKEALRSGIVAVDTNVILNLYKYTPRGTQDWFRAFEALDSRLWFPHQVILEFWRNRAELVAHPTHIKLAISNLEKGFQGINEAYGIWLREREGNAEKITEKAAVDLRDLNRIKKDLVKQLEDSRVEHEKRFDLNPENDEVTKQLSDLILSSGEGARIGEGYTFNQLEEKYREGDQRYRKKIPPGYLDDARSENAKAGKKGDTKYGDWIAWSQLLEEATKFGNQCPAKPGKPYVVFVTGDLKGDWWELLPQGDNKPKVRIAQPKLVREMLSKAGCHYIQLTPANFLMSMQKATKGLDIDESTLKKAEELGDEIDEADWYPELFYIKARDYVRATARIAPDGRCCVLKGSKARSRLAASFYESYRTIVQKLLDSGVLMQYGDNSEEYEFTEDWVFPSVSQGASIILGASVSGNERWVTDDGRTRLEVRNEYEDGSDD